MQEFISLLSDLYEKFQVAFTHDTNVWCLIWRFCCNLFLSYADNRNTHTHTDRTKCDFWIQGSSYSIKIFISKILSSNSTFSAIIWVRQSTNMLCKDHTSSISCSYTYFNSMQYIFLYFFLTYDTFSQSGVSS